MKKIFGLYCKKPGLSWDIKKNRYKMAKLVKAILLVMALTSPAKAFAYTHMLVCTYPEVNQICESTTIRNVTSDIILEEMVVWTNPNTLEPTYSRLCEVHTGGCEEHIRRVVDVIFRYSCENGMDPFVVLAMAKHESNYNPFAINKSSGAVGLLQLMPRSPFARGLDFVHNRNHREECRNDPEYCQESMLTASFNLLSRSIDRCGSLRQGLGMYGSGSCSGSRTFASYVINRSSRLKNTALIRNEHSWNQFYWAEPNGSKYCIHNDIS